jgi:hypothetical protein
LRPLALLAAVLLAAPLPGCFNRALARIPGAAGSFHAASTGYTATRSAPLRLRVAFPNDTRAAHHGERVAGTRWTGCETDPFWGGGPQTVRFELERELRDTGIAEAAEAGDASALVLDTEIRALCAQAIGFVWLRVAGITALHFTLRDGDRVLYERTIEKVVTDADEEYTGSQATFIEQAMKVLISDSLRAVFSELVRDLDRLELPAPQPTGTGGGTSGFSIL